MSLPENGGKSAPKNVECARKKQTTLLIPDIFWSGGWVTERMEAKENKATFVLKDCRNV